SFHHVKNNGRGALCACLGILLLSLIPAAHGGDWPQILGPHRNGQADGEQLIAWPAAGPELIWQRDVGHGFAGVAIARGRAVLFHRRKGELVAEALDAATGKPLWKVTFPTKYVSTISSDDGPRCTPVIHDDSVFLLGPGGELACVAFETGKQI